MAAAPKRFDWSTLRRSETSAPIEDQPALEIVPGTTAPPRPSSGPGSRAPLPLRVNDLKQFEYCPRIVFYHYLLPVRAKATYKMEHGRVVELTVERLERRRTLRRYHLEDGERSFQVPLQSDRLGLSGKLDLMIRTEAAVFPIDFKDTLEPVRDNHRVQLCGYALLIEDVLGQPAPTGFIYRVPREDIVVVPMTEELRVHTWRRLDEIRAMIWAEQMPEPTTVRSRCNECEYRNYCGDVF